MKKLKLKQAVVVSLAMTGLLAGQAYAAQAQVESLPAQPVATLSEAEVNALFIKALFDHNAGQPMQLAALSQQEMMETEGALAPVILGWMAIGGAAGGAFHVMRTGTTRGMWRGVVGGAHTGFFASPPVRIAWAAATPTFGRILGTNFSDVPRWVTAGAAATSWNIQPRR